MVKFLQGHLGLEFGIWGFASWFGVWFSILQLRCGECHGVGNLGV